MSTQGLDPQFYTTHQKLLQVNRKYHLLQVVQAFLWFFIWGVGIFLLFVCIEMLFDLTPPLRMAFWALVGGGLLYFLRKRVWPHLRCGFFPTEQDLYQISRQIGRHNPEVQDSLINFLQIYRDQGIVAHPAIKNLSLKQLYERFKETNFFAIISLRGLRKPLRRLLATLGALLGIFLLFPSATSQTVLKMLHPTRSFDKPLPVTLMNISGDKVVLKNDPVELRGRYQGIMPTRLWMVIRTQSDTGDSTARERLEIPLSAGKSFSYTLHHVKNSFAYWFEASVDINTFDNRQARSEKGVVTVKERPYIRELQARLTFPRYTRLPETLLPVNDGEVTALKGTVVELRIETNKSLAAAEIVFKDTTRVEMMVQENRARGEFVVEKDNQYRVLVRDLEGVENYQPVQYAVFVLQDESPFVEIARPGQDLELGEELQIPVLVNLRDDFGFSGLELKGKHVKAGGRGDTSHFALRVNYQVLEQGRAIAESVWDLAPFFLVPDDYIEYYAEVRDNDIITGPKVARSQTYIIRLPSIVDLLTRADEKMTEQLEDTEDISRETEELRKKLEEINRELKREESLSWERKQQIQEQMDRQQKHSEKMQEIQQKMQEVIEQLEQQEMLSPETLEKFLELQKMFQEIAPPELQEAMKELQKALEEADMEQIREAMERFQFSVQEFEERIERTHELFKRVQMEQKMDELNKLAEKLVEDQKEINEQLKQDALDASQQEQLANKEQDQAKNSDYLKEELRKAQEEFAEMMAEIARELEKSREFMEESQLGEQMSRMEQQIQQGELQQARKSGKELQRQLEMLQSMMNQARQQMQQQQKQELMQAMQKVQQDMLRASFQQEQLVEQSQNMDVASSKITEAARQQSQLRENAANMIKQLVDISKKSFFISPEMSKIMQSLMQNMEEGLQSLANRNPRSAARSQQKAMANFNQAIMSMQNSMENMMAAGSGTGFEQFMEQLQKMAGQQGQLNQQTMSLFQQGQQPGGKVPVQALAQAAAQQQMIQNSLEKLTEGTGNRQDVLGRLGELGAEMEKVIEDLKKQRLDPKVIERQQRILSRLLDAQKSVREREHSKKRIAEHEPNAIAKSPPQLKKEMIERENKLRKEMLEALKEGYSAEYKEYIKLYYDILSRQSELKP